MKIRNGLALMIFAYTMAINILAVAQKNPVNNFSHQNWPFLKDNEDKKACIKGPLGIFFAYQYGPQDGIDTIIVSNASGDFILKKTIKSGSFKNSIIFSQNEDKVAILFKQDSLEVFNLKERKSLIKIADVQSFEFLKNGSSEYLIVKNNNTRDEVSIYSLPDFQFKVYSGYYQYHISNDKKLIYLTSGLKLAYVDLTTFKEKILCTGFVSAFDLDLNQNQVYILNLNQDKSFAILKYALNKQKADTIISSGSKDFPSGYVPAPNELFVTSNHQCIVFKLRKISALENEIATSADRWRVWSYTDKFITQTPILDTVWTGVFNVRKQKFYRLYNETESPIGDIRQMINNGHIITQTRINEDEYNWNHDLVKATLYNLETGSAIKIDEMVKFALPGHYNYSPRGKFVFWWSPASKEYFTFDISSQKKRSIVKDGKIQLYERSNDIPFNRSEYGVARWADNDNELWIYDEFDIWKFDPLGVKIPTNLTRGEGIKNRIKIRVFNAFHCVNKESLLLSLFDVETKNSGFDLFSANRPFALNKMKLASYAYGDNRSINASMHMIADYVPVQLGTENMYIVRRESATESPNLFSTKDFSTYKKLTNIDPEKSYEWFCSKLLKWTTSFTKSHTGILYYPQNLDTTKKYPVIIHYYEKSSDELNHFKRPELGTGDIDISWYATNGYLVFVPDMQYETGNLRESICNNIQAAVDELRKLRWVDVYNIGLQGHSFGGYQTYLLITKMNVKAAQVSSGLSNPISYFSHVFGGRTRQTYMELNQGNTGTTPWENRDAFIRNYPVLFASEINTPILIMHGQKDDNGPVSQSIEMYAALRRLKKPAWLLIYKDAYHNLSDSTDKLDFNIKQQEFFGYFLKGHKKPLWLR